ncbi:MAG: hypothetical protein WEE89_13025 [Gemmatimonadota bacterium]
MQAIDARTDIYALAAVLYEMLVGEPPHTGKTTQAIIAKILADRPAHPRVLRETVPEHVDAAVMIALAKLPADRFVSAAEFAETLSGTRAPARIGPATTRDIHENAPASTGAAFQRVRHALAWTIPAVVVAALFTIARVRDEQSLPEPVAFEFTFDDRINVFNIIGPTAALSRDGTQLAFVANGPAGPAIYHRQLDGFGTRAIRGTENGIAPEFSPDGEWLLFSSQQKLKKVLVSGGSTITIADSVGGSNGRSWREQGEIVFERRREIWRVAAAGGMPPTKVTQLDSASGHRRYGWPFVLPGGKTAVITIWKGAAFLDSAQLGIVRLRDGKVTELHEPGFNARYLSSGHIVYGRPRGAILAATFSPRKGITGQPTPMLEQVIMSVSGATTIAISDNGLVVYKAAGSPLWSELVQVDRQGRGRPLVRDSGTFNYPRLDATGKLVTTMRGQRPGGDIWIYELSSGARSRLTSDSRSDAPEWGMNRTSIVYMNYDLGQIRVQSLDRSSPVEVFPDTGFRDVAISRRANVMAVSRRLASNTDIWVGRADSLGSWRALVNSSANENVPTVSPDGRLLAYASDEQGRPEVFLRAIAGPGKAVPVSIDGADEPMWSPNGRELFYRTVGQGRVFMSATITEQPEVAVTKRDTLFADPFPRSPWRTGYDVFPDGQTFVFVRLGPVTAASGFYGIANWTTALKRLSSGKQQ